nr:MAG TPA: hypothetical protein [Caudoviricetes sp.]
MRRLTRRRTSLVKPCEWVAIRLRGSPYYWNGYGFTQSIVMHPRFAISNLIVHLRNVYHLDVEMIDSYHLDKEDERMNVKRVRTYMQYEPVDDDDDE